jgi:hypothetical protein
VRTAAAPRGESPAEDIEEGDDDDDAYEDGEEGDAAAGRRNGSSAAADNRKRKRSIASSTGSDSKQEASTSLMADEDANGVARTPRACSWCRRRKRKCDGASPCQWCAKGNLACSYPSALLKRGPQSGMMRKLKKKVEELEQQLSVRRQHKQRRTTEHVARRNVCSHVCLLVLFRLCVCFRVRW